LAVTDGTYTIVCTGDETHKRYPFNDVTVVGAEIKIRPTRVANMPELKGGSIDGAAVSPKAILPAPYDPRAGRDSWRFDCPRCPVDRRLSTEALRVWLNDVGAKRRRVADISKMSK
jgi:hypothetical protein